MLSTRFTGSSTSLDEGQRGVVGDQPLLLEELAEGREPPVEEHARVRVDRTGARHVGQRRVPVVSAEHLVGALAGLHDFHMGRHFFAQ
jgi:hypothetical protein